MVHRTDDAMAQSYGELEFQQLSAFFSQDGGNADEEVEVFKNVEPVEPQGLDNDEIAELVYMDVEYAVVIRDDSTDNNQTELGNAIAEYSIEVNPGNRDGQILNLTANGDAFTDGENLATGDGALFEDDEPGRLFFGLQAVTAGFSSGAEGRGGGTDAGESSRFQQHFRDTYGRGPAVDANDDLGVFMEIDNDNVTAGINIQMTAQLVWDVHTVEGQRGQFALP